MKEWLHSHELNMYIYLHADILVGRPACKHAGTTGRKRVPTRTRIIVYFGSDSLKFINNPLKTGFYTLQYLAAASVATCALQLTLAALQSTLLALWPIRICFALFVFLFPTGWMCNYVRPPVLAGPALDVLYWRASCVALAAFQWQQEKSTNTWWNSCSTRTLCLPEQLLLLLKGRQRQVECA
jgi:hypothetical protein